MQNPIYLRLILSIYPIYMYITYMYNIISPNPQKHTEQYTLQCSVIMMAAGRPPPHTRTLMQESQFIYIHTYKNKHSGVW